MFISTNPNAPKYTYVNRYAIYARDGGDWVLKAYAESEKLLWAIIMRDEIGEVFAVRTL